ncbi:hypothetical protein PaecuDRAFT_0373 [Paenibacillus curdlanolyticus YK9]|uniref:Uncharacterized protein n=1 Tax=Paenibacillus curdlanolyticus YK9 TaxID=717606 RepID=E0I3J8_9BACL|nr:hypothetical protein [Paenibacillus curdlanolyticus]EFM12862.1 hypothetical protein PaecuDRAFT_0373 [Paenibacillus curdlanolyticus YK9]
MFFILCGVANPGPTPEEKAAIAQKAAAKAEAKAESEEAKLAKNKAEEAADQEAERKKQEREQIAVKEAAAREQKDEQNAEGQQKAQTPEQWTVDNVVEHLNKLDALNGKGKFTDQYDFPSQIVKHDKSAHGKTNLRDAYVVQLSIVDSSDGSITNDETIKDMAFHIVQELHNHQKNIAFNISLVELHFPNTDNEYGAGGVNFIVGMNVVQEYFKKPRTSMVSVDKATGETVELQFDAASFYEWIEVHFTMPEDERVLAEDTAWTLISDKAKP